MTISVVEQTSPTRFVGTQAGIIPFCLAIATTMISGMVINIDQVAPAVVAFFQKRPRYIAGTHAPKAAVAKRNAYIIVAPLIEGLSEQKYTTMATAITEIRDTKRNFLPSSLGKKIPFIIEALSVADACWNREVAVEIAAATTPAIPIAPRSDGTRFLHTHT